MGYSAEQLEFFRKINAFCDISQYYLLKKCSEAKKLSAWNEWRENNPHQEINLTGADLSGFYLKEVIFILANLQGAILQDAKCGYAKFTNANLQDAKCQSADFSYSDCRDTDFFNANCNNTKFKSANCENACFSKAYLTDSFYLTDEFKTGGVEMFFQAYKKYPGADFTFANCDGAKFHHAKCWGAIFENATCNKAVFEDAKLDGANFSYVKCKGSNLKYAICRGARFVSAECQKSSFHGADCTYVSFHGSNCQEASFIHTVCTVANFKQANCKKTDFGHADCREANFSYSNLTESGFMETKLYQANFNNVILDNCRFDECEVDNATNFSNSNLSAALIPPDLKAKLEQNVRRINWQKWYASRKWHKIWTLPVRYFWHISDYGYSTLRVFTWFAIYILFFASIYSLFPDLLQISGKTPATTSHSFMICGANISFEIANFLQMLAFAASTMVTLGFSNINVAVDPSGNPSTAGMVIVSLNLMVGYFMLAVLVTRLAILFQTLGPNTYVMIKPDDKEQYNRDKESKITKILRKTNIFKIKDLFRKNNR